MWTDPLRWVTARFFFCFFCCFFLWSCPDLRLCSLVLDCVTVFWVDIEDQRGLWKGVGRGQGCWALSKKKTYGCLFPLFSFFFCHPLPPLSLWLSLSLTLDWWNCQWFITNVSGRRSRLLFCPCQSQVEPEVGSFAYQSKPLRSPPPPLSVQSLLDHYLSKPRATVVMEMVAYGSREAETNRKWHKTFQVSLLLRAPHCFI